MAGVGKLGQKVVEVFAYAGDEADTGVEGDDEDGGQKHLSHPAKQAVGQCRQDGGAGVAAGERGPEMPPMWVSMA